MEWIIEWRDARFGGGHTRAGVRTDDGISGDAAKALAIMS